MPIIHFLNVLEGDCNIIQHDSGRISVIDISNAYNDEDTEEEKAVKASQARKAMLARTKVPSDKVDYQQKKSPDNPIDYLKNNIKATDIFRFIISHPDMDHLDGIEDLFSEFTITNTWDTDNVKSLDLDTDFGGYNKDDWRFYTNLRDGGNTLTKRLTYYDDSDALYWNKDDLKILAPSKALLNQANEEDGDIHDLSYVLLFTPPKTGGGKWKIIFAGDSHDNSWDHILEKYADEVSDIDVLFAPHHGRDSNRNYEFLKTLKPRVTLFGNASSAHLAYNCYKPIRITNNQAGYVIIEILPEKITFYVKNYEFARDFKAHRNWGEPSYNKSLKAYGLFKFNA
jgi:beta-lactamase superfamily II metal-dependent hydrolase